MGSCQSLSGLSNTKPSENQIHDATSSATLSVPTPPKDTMSSTAHTTAPSLHVTPSSLSSTTTNPTATPGSTSPVPGPSTALSVSPPKCDVFISHAGEDKATIAIPLREKLLKHDITAFVDEADMPKGTKAVNAMESAMETAKIGVIVLSPEFFSRKWPMKELMCFLRRIEESNGGNREAPVVIPFFYRLNIHDLYSEPRLDRLDKNGKRLHEKSRFFERMKKGGPEADVLAVKASLQTLHGSMGVRNDIDASNDGSYLMNYRRELLLRELFEKVQEAMVKSRPLKRHVNMKETTRTGDEFHACFNTPLMIPNLVFDFSYQEEDVKSYSQEANLLEKILDESQSDNTSIGVLGIGGVGKTSLMHGISSLEAVKDRFTDGVYYFSLGIEATKRDLIRELINAVKSSGGRGLSESLNSIETIEDLIREFRLWFAKRKCLFIVDDVWQTREISASIIHELLRLGISCEKSRVLLTTRSVDVASWTDSYFELKPRNPVDARSRLILVRYAGIEPDCEQDEKVVNEILEGCSGLPLFLAIAGKAVRALRFPRGHEEQAAYQIYARRLRGKVQSMLTTGIALYERLDARLMISLDLLEERKSDFRFQVRLSMKESHRRLSVLRKQSRVPMTMLKFLWEVENESQAALIAGEFEKVGLANLEIEKRGSEYCELLRLHDSLYEFAVMETRKHDEERTGHEALLRGYGCGLTMKDGCHNWWDFLTGRDDYIDANLCRHLLGAGRSVELVYLLLSPEWTVRQVKKNGILYLEADFSLGITAMQDHMRGVSEGEVFDLKEAIDLISQAVTLSSGFVTSNIVELPFQLHGRLKIYCENNRAIRAYCSSFEREPERPSILCKTSFLSEPGTGTTKIVSIGIRVVCMTTMKDGERFACGCSDGRIAVVNVRRSVVEKVWEAHADAVRAIAVTSDGMRLVSGSLDKTTKVWEVETAECVTSFTDHTDRVYSVAVMKNNRRAISTDDFTGSIWDLNTGKILSKPLTVDDERSINCVAVLGTEEDVVVTGGGDGRLRMWNVTTGAQVGGTFDGHDDVVSCITVTSNGHYVVSGSWDNTLRMWDVRSQQQIGNSLKGHTSYITCVAVSGDGSRLVSGSDDQTMRVWDLESQAQICDPLEGHTSYVYGVSFLEGLNDRVVSSSDDGTVRGWDVAQSKTKKLRNQHESFVSCISFSADGKLVVSGSYDKTLRVWDTSSGEQVTHALKRHSDIITDVAATTDGRYIVSVSADKTIFLWDPKSFKVLCTLTGHTDWIWCVAVTPWGDQVVTGSFDNTVRVWDLQAMGESHVILDGHTCEVLRVFVSDDGLRIVSVDREDNIFVWQLETKKLVRKFEKEEASKLSRRQVLNIIGEATVDDDATLSIPQGGREILYGDGANQMVLATMEGNIRSWALSPDKATICVGLDDGQVAFMKLET